MVVEDLELQLVFGCESVVSVLDCERLTAVEDLVGQFDCEMELEAEVLEIG